MQNKSKADNLLSQVVTEGVTVHVLPNEQHEYLMTTKEVANGYGISEYTLRRHKMEHSSELQEGRHFVTAVQILNGDQQGALKIPHNAVLWTKRGIVRLGFFIRSERAKLFRDWAEELIIRLDEQRELFGMSVPTRALPKKRNHNRLTSERLIRLLQLTHRIDDAGLRNEIVAQLMGGR
ncbi:MAG: hypothetical protein LBS55_12095 [Prevotellaceae bacterium]|nr:hypothetical protein [Prevotellaceae bacterium]